MWDDFKIGATDHSTTAFNVAGYPGLAQSAVSYWWTSTDFNRAVCIGGRINKDTAAGRRIKKMIDEEVSAEEMLSFLMRLGLSRMTPVDVLKFLHRVHYDGFDEGQLDKQNELRKCLGLQEAGRW